LTLTQDQIFVGAFELPAEIASYVTWYTPLSNINISSITDENIRTNATLLSTRSGLYIGKSSEGVPNIGDTRVTFSSVQPDVISVIAQQDGSTFKRYQADAGGTLLIVRQGVASAQQLYDEEEAANQALTWILRFVGFLVMGFGIFTVLRPIAVIADVVPWIGNIIEKGLLFVAFFIAGIFSSITIGIAWLIHHPKIGAAVLFGTLAFVCGIAFLVNHLKNKNKPPSPAPSAAPIQPNKINEQPYNGGDEEIVVEAQPLPQPIPPPVNSPSPQGDFANALDN